MMHSELVHAAGYPPGPPGGGYGGPPPGAPPGGYGGPPPGAPPGGYGGPPPGNYGQPPANYGQPPGGFGGPPGAMGPPGFPQPGGADVQTTLPLVLNIVGILFGCCSYGIGSVLGIIGLVFTIMAMTSKDMDPMGARGKAKVGLILSIVSCVITLALFGLFLALGAFGAIMGN